MQHSTSKGVNKMKISVTYLFTIMKYGYPPKPEDDMRSFGELSKLGFHYLEMEGLGKEHAEIVLRNQKDYKKAMDDAGIHVHNFCIVDPDLVSLSPARRQAAYGNFERMLEVAAFLESESVHLASYAPPMDYVGSSPYSLGEDYSMADKLTMRIPDGFSWDRVWEALVESSRFCAEKAARLGLTVLMEPRVGEVICSVDSLLRLMSDVGADNLKANFDAGHFSAQRENVCLALMKLEAKYANIHISDNDPQNAEHIAVGDGVIDWNEFFRILKNQGYDGYLGLDLSSRATLENDLLRSRDFIQKVAAAEGLPELLV
jgi:sugar phosphate isomerase/epimerase